MQFGFTEVEFVTSGDSKFITTKAYTVDPYMEKMVEEATVYNPATEEITRVVTNYNITEEE